jgi:predicted nucleotidyltransferase
MDEGEEIRDVLLGLLREDNQVVFAYIFGSIALGVANKESDIDVAVYLDMNEVEDAFTKRIKLIEKFQTALGGPVDVVILNDLSSLFFKFVIIKEGQVIFERDHGQRVNFELKTMQEYYDFLPFLEAYNKAYIQRTLHNPK